MAAYTICDCAFYSNIPLPELIPCNDREAVFAFHLSTETGVLLGPCQWLNTWQAADGSVWLAFGRLRTGYVLRFPALADFLVSADACSVRCYPRAGCPRETIRHLLLNQVIPILLSHLGKLVLHASACATPRGCMAFMGMTGAGKSTLAASLGLRGLPVLTDDCLLLEERNSALFAVPSYPGVRLWPETVTALFDEEPTLLPLAHYTDKQRLVLRQDQFTGLPALGAVYVLAQEDDLQDDPDVTIAPLTASEALLETVKHTFQLDTTDRQRLGQAFRRHERLAKSVPFFRLAFPRDHAYLPAVHTAVLDHFDNRHHARH